MGHASHLSRREILNAIPVLTSGSLLLPLRGETGAAPLGVIRGAIRDGATGGPIAAKLRVTNLATGDDCMPAACIETMPKRGPAIRYFYVRGAYELAVAPGRYRIEVVRGICHEPATAEVEVKSGRTETRDFPVRLLWDLRASGWYSGNTHTHYNVDIEETVDDRLRLVPSAEGVDAHADVNAHHPEL
jgi:hypothetical protein